jgi:hypothetical protein
VFLQGDPNQPSSSITQEE